MAAEKNKKDEMDDFSDLDIVDAGEDDLEAQMAATMAAEGLGDSFGEDDLEAQMAAAMAAEMGGDSEDDLEAQMAAAMAGDDDSIGGGILKGMGGFDDDDELDARAQPMEFKQLRPSDEPSQRENVDRLLDVSLSLSVELGRKQMQIRDILELGPGKIIELDKLAGEPVDLLVNGKILAKGEVVVVDENFGVRITDLINPKDRIRSL